MLSDQEDKVGMSQSMMMSRGSDDAVEMDHGNMDKVVEVLGEMGV